MKSYTDIEQSKKLEEVSLESAGRFIPNMKKQSKQY